MIFDKPIRERSRCRSALGKAALAGVLGVIVAAGQAGAQSFNPFGAFTDSGPVTKEERARREQVRTDLYERLSPYYRMNVPFVSQTAIAGLEQAIARYRQIAAAGGWPLIAGKATFRPGDRSAEIAAIRQRLIIEGDLPPDSGRSANFDQDFLEGLSRFQIRNGLRVTGFVDSRTLRALNISAEERLHQLQTNLTRTRKLMNISKTPRYVLVNVPAYTLQAVERNQIALDSAVVVGKPQRATPLLSASVVEVNFYPTWSVPDTVARNDLIPAIRKNLDYFYEQRFNVMRDWGSAPLDPATVDWASPQVVNYKFRQDPGPQNALGLVRINMPNRHAVYMHDTPLKSLFNQSLRAFSSGCIRVEQVYELVAWLLAGQGWTLDKVQNQIDSGKRSNVKLDSPVPVHFVYLSAFAGEDGVAQFRPDIYGQDSGYGVDINEQDTVAMRESRAITP